MTHRYDDGDLFVEVTIDPAARWLRPSCIRRAFEWAVARTVGRHLRRDLDRNAT